MSKYERIVFVVGWVPGNGTKATSGGCQWFGAPGDAQVFLAKEFTDDTALEYDYVIRRVEVPKEVWEKDSRDAITAWLDANPSLWEVSSQE